MYFHTHNFASSTWRHAPRVKKRAFPHPNRRSKTEQQQKAIALNRLLAGIL
jgi:hypothetical protein